MPSDDFIVNVRQIGQYPLAPSVGPNDLLLLQQNGLGGPYASLNPKTLFLSTLANGGNFQLAPGAMISWNGAGLTYNYGTFAFSEALMVPSLQAEAVSVNGQPVATEEWVSNLFGSVTTQIVNTFNGRYGNVQLESDDILRAGGVLAMNPHFWGVVTAPTLWNYNDCTDSVATTAWVQGAIQQQVANGCIVGSINGRGGNVVLTPDDITTALTSTSGYAYANTPPSGDTSGRIATTMFVDDAIYGLQQQISDQIDQIAGGLDQQYAPINSPQFTGTPTAPTAAQTNNSGQLATTAFVHAAVVASTTGVSSFNTRTGSVVLTTADVTGAGGAALASPAFTGTPTAPTATVGTNTTQIATTAYVEAAIAAIGTGVTSFNSRTGAVSLTLADVTAVGGAPIASPSFSGTPQAPTPVPTDNSTRIATTAYVTSALAAMPAPVSSFNGRTGAVSFQASDISAVGGALLASPNFTGTPTAPTQSTGNSSTALATTAFVSAAVAASTAGVTSFNTRTGAVTLTTSDVTTAGGATIASPTFTGVPAAPTAGPGTNTTQLATTAFVTAAIAASPGGVTSFNSRTGAITLLGSDVSAAGGALLASPAFTGTPTAPTQTPGTSNTSIASTAFVANAVSSAGGVTTFNGRSGVVVLGSGDITGAGGALLASPTFTGIPAAPTATSGTNSTQLATTAFVQAALAAAPGGVSSFNTRTGAITLINTDITSAGGALIASPTFTGTPSAPTQPPNTNNTTLATTAYVAAALTAAGGVNSFNGRAGVVTFQASDLTSVGGAFIVQQDTAPALGANQTFWFDSIKGQLFYRYQDPSSLAYNWVQANTQSVTQSSLRNFIDGFQLTTTAASTSVSIGAGVCSDHTNTYGITLAAAITKTTAAWASGNNAGGLDTGTIANSAPYHLFVIINTTSGAVDATFSLSPTAPTLPSGFNTFRRVASLKTTSTGNWQSIIQLGDDFWLTTVTNGDAANAQAPGTTPTLYTFNVPTGLNMKIIGAASYVNTSGGGGQSYIWTPLIAATMMQQVTLTSPAASFAANQPFYLWGDTSGRLYATNNTVSSNHQLTLTTLGWTDARGRNGMP